MKIEYFSMSDSDLSFIFFGFRNKFWDEPCEYFTSEPFYGKVGHVYAPNTLVLCVMTVKTQNKLFYTILLKEKCQEKN